MNAATRSDPRPTYVSAIGDANSPLTWSGIPYHLTQAGKAVGLVTAGLALSPDAWPWRARRAAWNLARVCGADRIGGYQYSVGFLERLWRPVRRLVAGARVIHCAQLYPPSVLADDTVERWHFLDLTLTQLFDYYELRQRVGRRIGTEAVSREREGYTRATGFLAMSRFVADSLRHDYGVNEENIHIVVPGANLEPNAYRRWEQSAQARADGTSDVLRLVMVSTDWRRKGLDRLLRALAIARDGGLRARLRVIGSSRDELPRDLTEQDGIEWVGRINKDTDAARFLESVADADVGCILARYEAGGSVLREYHALGLAAFATDVGGMPDFMFPEATVTVDRGASDADVAAELISLGRDPDKVAALRRAAWGRRRDATWEAAVEKIGEAIGRPVTQETWG